MSSTSSPGSQDRSLTPGPSRDVLAQLSSTRPLFASYLRIRSLTTTPASPELASARADLEAALSSLAEDLADLVASVKAVEVDPARYGLGAAEVERRQRLVLEVGGEIEDMHEELAKVLDAAAAARGGTATTAPRTGTATGGGGGGGGDLPDPSSFSIPDGEGGGVADGDGYAGFEQHQQVQMMREQDQHLDGVFQTVGTLRQQADDMGRELEEQREMLDHTDALADRVGGRLQTGMQKLQYVIR